MAYLSRQSTTRQTTNTINYMRKPLFVTMLLACAPFGSSFAAYAEPAPQAQNQTVATITGTVLDENNEPVIGASVMQKGVKTNAVTTNFDGNFTIKVARRQARNPC